MASLERQLDGGIVLTEEQVIAVRKLVAHEPDAGLLAEVLGVGVEGSTDDSA